MLITGLYQHWRAMRTTQHSRYPLLWPQFYLSYVLHFSDAVKVVTFLCQRVVKTKLKLATKQTSMFWSARHTASSPGQQHKRLLHSPNLGLSDDLCGSSVESPSLVRLSVEYEAGSLIDWYYRQCYCLFWYRSGIATKAVASQQTNYVMNT